MSTDANAALAWPIKVTEPALIGADLVAELEPDEPGVLTRLWDGDREVVVPGDVRFVYSESADLFREHRSYPEVGMWWSEAALAWRVRPFTGDWLSDPLVREVGVRMGLWAITAEGDIMHASDAWVPPFENHEAPMGGDGVYAPTEEEQ